MEVIGEAVAAKFTKKHPVARKPLQRFLTVVKEAEWRHFPDVKQSFAAADYTPSGRTIFDIGGNKYRLIAVIHFNRGKLFVRHVLTHAEYDEGKWKDA